MLLRGAPILFVLSGLLLLAKADKPRLRLTKVGSKCPCWWDMEGKLIDPKTNEPYQCACCKPGGRQCGYPMHKWCTDDRNGIALGCEGINNWRHTLSEIGHPCHFNQTSSECAWCVHFAYQCGRDVPPLGKGMKEGQYCQIHYRNHKNCGGESQDCRLRPNMCSPDATCTNTNHLVGGNWFFHRCVCNKGYVGNGITCIRKSNGKLKQDVNVEVSLQLTLDRLFEPSTQPTIQYGPDTEDLILDMSEKENEASTCKACNAFVMQCGVSM